MKKGKRNLSIKAVISIFFIISILISISGISLLVFTNWHKSANESAESILRQIGDSIDSQITSFLRTPAHMTEVYGQILSGDLIDLADETARSRFFVEALSVHARDVYSFSYGSEQGEYYGARRNGSGDMEIMINDISTGGHSLYYSVNSDFTRGDLVKDAGLFDPRTRDWYQVAAFSQSAQLSSVYQHFVINDLAISAAYPIFDQQNQLQGVLAAHTLLSGIGKFLEDTVDDYEGEVLIVEQYSNHLVSNSLGIDNFITRANGSIARKSINEIDSDSLTGAYRYYKASSESYFLYTGSDARLFVNVSELHLEGVDWLILSAIPQGLLLDSVNRSIIWSVILVIIALLSVMIIYTLFMRRLMRPIDHLLEVGKSLSNGDFSKRVDIRRYDEIGTISQSMNDVADKISYLVNNLEDTVEQRTEEIRYLGSHDSLTGLHNRTGFDENKERFDRAPRLPLSVIFADINGLKLTNDIFGHIAGDKLIKKSAEILTASCRDSDFIARIGGDEFVILLPDTSSEDARAIVDRINRSFSQARLEAIKCSISLGYDTKYDPRQSLEEIMSNAENYMYKQKTNNRKNNNQKLLDNILETLFQKSPQEKAHADAVSQFCVDIGLALNLDKSTLTQLKQAGALHDIGKITLSSDLLMLNEFDDDQPDQLKQHSLVGYRLLSLFDETMDLADYIYSHHERWDGSGYPRGLRHQQIPLISRIIAAAEVYDRVSNRYAASNDANQQTALAEVKAAAGTQLDPQIVEVLTDIINRRLNSAET